MPDSPTKKDALTFAWWNTQDLFHFDQARTAHARWPSSIEAYYAKCDGVAQVLKDCDAALEGVDIIALAEVTEEATLDIRDRVVPAYEVLSFDLLPAAKLQVAFIFRPGMGIEARPPLTPQYVPHGARPMGVIDVVLPKDRIRVVACHWTALDGVEQRRTREREAQELAVYAYDFLRDPAPDLKPHLLVVGDFNEEPYAPTMVELLRTSRQRKRARRPEHYTDADVKRVHLYNAAWRLLGENRAFDGAEDSGIAGTMYWESERTWHTLDHVLVSGSLLTPDPPYLDEAALQPLLSPTSLVEGTPKKFKFENGMGSGVSDHLPLIGRIVLSRS